MGASMKTLRNLTVAGCSVLLLTQCASQDQVRELNNQLRAVNMKVDEVKTTTVNKMQKRQASSVNKLDQVEGETMRLQSMIEESAHQASLYREQSKEDLANMQAKIDAMQQEQQLKQREAEQKIAILEQQVALLTANMEREAQARVRAAEKRAREAARKAEEAKRQSSAAASSRTQLVKVKPVRKKVRIGSAPVVDGIADPNGSNRPEKRAKTTISALFAQAMKKYQAKKYQGAYHDFEQVLADNPQGKEAAETLFYMGESLFHQGEYDLAILDYQKVISNYAKSRLTPQALLKQGMSFEKLTDHETAKIIYQKLISDYSSSSEAQQAKTRLGNL
ncbi:MAG: hypothetical protein CSA31_02440 [Desulfobulbus propionicus]|nr:MAG: hypothetical protein CSA31_02440 [Desulfobulbus propionicus]